MRIAIPLTENRLSMHFGHAEEFALVEVNPEDKSIVRKERHAPPVHHPGVLPQWLKSMEVDVVIAGGMGERAKMLFLENSIAVRISPVSESIENLVQAFFDNSLAEDVEPCGGGHGKDCHHVQDNDAIRRD